MGLLKNFGTPRKFFGVYTAGVTDELIRQLIDFGGLGGFAGFLVWQFLQMQKRLDNLVEKFQEQVREISEDHDTRVERMRARYDVVIADIRADCSTTINKLQDEVKQAQRDLLARERESLYSLRTSDDE